ncbi:M20/M25/M40 family metallo-hydrolase [Glaciimonas immobilis]|uniref:Acetylornithine deacetylase/succinyl-diaminopimelate desuccinylase family protein n=1 Tax=Glaciimonas immobilis TaxID=728004 RepID=A0A840RST2_9BURK|nr:M20/M25/M40 family metallo-hydrolase [Glaciimonas immobilis]KAF3996807.1 M20/M25/M40 family metallo-hydrolase [Glaciimonas immobilis]MBB5199651.1 acetylornithine deacetylase/succinyl-diaminopimelate desuccinylase family protein [Glaciimonas immobilis]
MANPDTATQLSTWIDDHFDEEVAFLQTIVRIPTDTPPGNNAPHAEVVAELIGAMGWAVEKHPVPAETVHAYGMESITNLIVRRRYDASGPTIALNAHGDVVPPGDGWTTLPYGGEIVDGRIYGRATAVSKGDFATFIFAVRALEALGVPLKGSLELHFTYDEEFGGLLGPGWLLENKLTTPDYVIAPGFSYNVVTAHNACLQFEITVHGKATHGSAPETGHDALQAATLILQAIYARLPGLKAINSAIPGITHPTMIVGRIDGGTNTNVVPGKVVLKMDRRMIPEEDPTQVESDVRAMIADAVAGQPGIRVEIKRLLLARALRPLPGHEKLSASLQKNAEAIFGEPITTEGSALYTDARLYGEQGIPVVLYGAGPRTLSESNAKQADENLALDDLRKATKVVSMTLLDFLQA